MKHEDIFLSFRRRQFADLTSHITGSGPGVPPLRGLAGFPVQQPQQSRNVPLVAGRLPNGKLGMSIIEFVCFDESSC